jgi:prepilin peptidase CpaA
MYQVLLLTMPLLMIAAAISDIQRHIIPNSICIALAITGLCVVALSGMHWLDALKQLGVGAAALVIGFLLFAFGVWGGGDGKLIAAGALWFDPSAALTFLIYTLLAGGAVALIGLAAYFFRVMLWRIPSLRALPIERWREVTPYAVGIAIGAIAAFPNATLYSIGFP